MAENGAAKEYRIPANREAGIEIGEVKAGETWRFRATGRWVDWFIPCGPAGFRNFVFDILDILPEQPGRPWLSLLARVDRGDSAPEADVDEPEVIEIGRGCDHTFRQSGKLIAFANDHRGYYRNNRGRVRLYAGRSDAWYASQEDRTHLRGLMALWRKWLDLLERTRGILFITALVVGACLVLPLTNQGRDLIRTVGEEEAATGLGRMIAFALALLFLGVQAWIWPRLIINSNYGFDRKRWRPQWLLEWFPRLLGAAPFVLVLWAMVQSPASNMRFVLILVVVAALFLAWIVWRKDIAVRVEARVGRKLPERLGRWWVIFTFGFSIVCMLIAIFNPVGLAQMIGPPAVAFLAIGLIIPPMVVLIQQGGALGIPVTGLMISAAVVFGFWVDNHQVGRRAFVGVPVEPPAARLSLEEAYAAWRGQAPRDKDGTLPVVLIASQGGASRAGLWTAEVLASLHDRTDGVLAQSTFAISPVSGGSVGAVGYVGALEERPLARRGEIGARVRGFAGKDFLSPALASLLFPDLLQRFVPVAVLPDAAEGLERAFEAGWRETCPNDDCRKLDRLRSSFLSLAPRPGGPWRPLLLINGASEQTGRRILTSPVSFTADQIDADDFYLIAGREVVVSTAISNGARFPWISPPGTLGAGCEKKGQIVDGGYFDASGLETVRELALALASGPARRHGDRLRFILIFIGYEGAVRDAQPAAGVAAAAPPRPPKAQWRGRPVLNDAFGPFIGLLGARTAHGSHMMRSAKAAVAQNRLDVDPWWMSWREQAPQGQEANPPLTGAYVPILLCDRPLDGDDEPFSPPMDWALSATAREYMRVEASDQGECKRAAPLIEAAAALIKAATGSPAPVAAPPQPPPPPPAT